MIEQSMLDDDSVLNILFENQHTRQIVIDAFGTNRRYICVTASHTLSYMFII